MASIVATSSGSASFCVREKIATVRVAMFLEMFTTVGAILGATITTVISPVLLYFLWEKDFKFSLITLFAFLILTLSLAAR